MDMHWGAEEAKREAEEREAAQRRKGLERGTVAMGPGYWHELGEAAERARRAEVADWLRGARKQVNDYLFACAAEPPKEIKFAVDGPLPSDECMALLCREYEKAGWCNVRSVGIGIYMNAPVMREE